jgi:hypothetical protein
VQRKDFSNFTINGRPADAPRPYTPPPAPAQPERAATRAEQAFATLEQTRQAYRMGLDELRRRTELTVEGKAVARAELATQHARRVDASEAEVKALRDEAAADYAAKRAQLATVEHTAEGEQKASRVWQRHRTALDNAKSPTAKLREIIATAPQDELAVVLQEAPAHLDAHGQPTTWVDQAVEQRDSELAPARQRLEKANRLAEVAQVEVAKLRKGFQTGDTPTQPLVDAPKLGFDPDI